MSWDKESLVDEEKAGTQRADDGKAITHNFPKADQGQPSLWATAALKEEPSLPSSYCWACCYMVCSISLASLDQLPQLCPVPNSLPTSSLFILKGENGAQWETGKTLMLCKCCWAVAKTLVCYQGCFSHRSKTRYPVCAAKEANSMPTRLSKSWLAWLWHILHLWMTCLMASAFRSTPQSQAHLYLACPPGRAMGPLSCE